MSSLFTDPCPWISKFQSCIHLLAGACLLPQLHLSVQSKLLQGIQQSTCKVCGHAQHTFLQFCHNCGLLPVPANQGTLLCFATFLADAKGLQHGTILRYLYEVRALHIDLGLSDPLKGIPAEKGLWAIHIQSNPVSHKLAFTYELQVLTRPLHKFPARVLWAALIMAHFGFLQTGKFTVDQETFDPAWHLCVQDVTPHLTVQEELQYIAIHLKVSKTDPFAQGIDMIIDCSGTQVCRACSAWDLIQ